MTVITKTYRWILSRIAAFEGVLLSPISLQTICVYKFSIFHSGSGFPINIQYIFLFLLCKLQAQTIINTGQMATENNMHILGGFTNVVNWQEVV